MKWRQKICRTLLLALCFLLAATKPAKCDFVKELSEQIFLLIDQQERNFLAGQADNSYVYRSQNQSDFEITQDMSPYFSGAAVKEADQYLNKLDLEGKKTIFFYARQWFDYNANDAKGNKKDINDFKVEFASKILKVKNLVQEKLNMSQANVNLHLCLHVMVQESLTIGQVKQGNAKYTSDIYFDELFINYNLNDACASDINKILRDAIKGKTEYSFSKNKDEALKFRAKVLWENLKDCGKNLISNVLLGDFVLDQSSNYLEGFSYTGEYVKINKGSNVLYQLVAKNQLRIAGLEDNVTSKSYFWDENTRWYRTKNATEYDNWWGFDMFNAGVEIVRPMAMVAGADPDSRKAIIDAYSNYNGTFVEFGAKMAKDGIVELVSDIKNSGYRRTQLLRGFWMGTSLATPSLGISNTLFKNFAKIGLKVGGKTLRQWTFVTLLNVEIFKYSLDGSLFTFKAAFQKAGTNLTPLYILKTIKYNTDLDNIAQSGTVEIVKDASGNIGWRVVKNIEELVGKYDWGLVRRYFQHIQDITGRAVGQKQIDKLKDALRAKEYTRLSPADVEKHRKKFTTSVKNKCIADWERETGQIWPKYTEVVYDKNGDVYKKIGDVYDAHHIIENKFEGSHEWWNMHPAKFPDEHQSGIHGTNSPANELFK